MAPEITSWWVCFSTETTWRYGRLIPGRFKHVSLIGHQVDPRLWLFYDHGWKRGELAAVPNGLQADALMARFTAGGAVIHIRPGPGWRPGPRRRLGLTCVSTVKHMIGLPSGALLPDGLWRDCLRNGGTLINGTARTETGPRPAA